MFQSLERAKSPLQIKPAVFSELIGNVSINDYLDDLFHKKPVASFDSIFNNQHHGLVLLFAASVAVAAEDWSSGRSFSERGLMLVAAESPRDEATVNEARYLRALTLRFTVQSEEDILEAQELLRICEDFYRGQKDYFGWIRSISEAAAIICVSLYKDALVEGFTLKLSERSKIEYLDRCQHHLRMGQELLDDVEDESRNEARLFKRLGLQLYTIRAALSVYAFWLMPFTSNDRILMSAAQDLSELQRRIQDWAQTSPDVDTPYTSQVFSNVLGFVLAADSSSKIQYRQMAKDLLEKLLKFETELVDFDLAEYRFFLSRVSGPL